MSTQKNLIAAPASRTESNGVRVPVRDHDDKTRICFL